MASIIEPPRALGAQMAVHEEGLCCGYVFGGCTEAAVAAEALRLWPRERPVYAAPGRALVFRYAVRRWCDAGHPLVAR